jgi:hypothetical protein
MSHIFRIAEFPPQTRPPSALPPSPPVAAHPLPLLLPSVRPSAPWSHAHAPSLPRSRPHARPFASSTKCTSINLRSRNNKSSNSSNNSNSSSKHPSLAPPPSNHRRRRHRPEAPTRRQCSARRDRQSPMRVSAPRRRRRSRRQPMRPPLLPSPMPRPQTSQHCHHSSRPCRHRRRPFDGRSLPSWPHRRRHRRHRHSKDQSRALRMPITLSRVRGCRRPALLATTLRVRFILRIDTLSLQLPLTCARSLSCLFSQTRPTHSSLSIHSAMRACGAFPRLHCRNRG